MKKRAIVSLLLVLAFSILSSSFVLADSVTATVGNTGVSAATENQNAGENQEIPIQANGKSVKVQASGIVKEKIQAAIKAKNQIKVQAGNINSGDIPEGCEQNGATLKCYVEGGREMTIRAGNSGNTIVQIQGANMATNVTLYKSSEGKLYGIFNNTAKEIGILPDQVQQRVREMVHAQLAEDNEGTIELKENGAYKIKTRKKARLFGFIPVSESVNIEIDAETGEVLKKRNSWWGFLARDVKAETS